MGQDGATTSDYFQVRRLLWDELQLNVRASEEQELRGAIGSYLIDENEDLRQELAVLVEILAEFQQQNDDIRDALTKRPLVPEPPGRPLLLEKLKLLASELRAKASSSAIRNAKDAEILEYILSSAEDSDPYASPSRQAPMTPKMSDAPPRSFPSAAPSDGIPLRPGTGGGKRPATAGSQRPASRGSTISISSISALLENPEVQRRLNLDEIDAIKDDLQQALVEERQLLLEDIEFIQGCLEMEKDLIDDDRRKVATAKSAPSLSELHAFSKTLEKTLEDQEESSKMEKILSKASGSRDSGRGSRVLHPVPSPPTSSRGESPASARRPALPSLRISSSTSSSLSRSGSAAKVLKIRHIVQESRDEPYLS